MQAQLKVEQGSVGGELGVIVHGEYKLPTLRREMVRVKEMRGTSRTMKTSLIAVINLEGRRVP